MIGAGAIFSLLAAEGLAGYALAELLAAGGGRTAAWWAFVLVSLVGYALPRLVEAIVPSSRRSEAVVAVAGLVLVYALLRLEFAGDVRIWDFSWAADFIRDTGGNSSDGVHAVMAAVLLAAVWLHGVNRSANGIELDLLPRQVGFELAAITAVVVVGAFGDRAGDVARASGAFYAMAVITLACSQLALSGASVGDREAGGILGALLVGTLGATIAGLVLITVSLAFIGPIVGPPLAAAIDAVLVAVVTPFAWLITAIFQLFLGGHAEWPKPNLTPIVTNGDPKQQGSPDQNPIAQWAVYVIRAGLLVVIAGAAYGVFRWVGRVRQRIHEIDLARPDAAASGSLREDLGAAVRSLFRRSHPSGGSLPSSRAARLYHDVLAASERAGHPRAPARTPSEFAPELSETLQSPVTDEITRAFEQARYAGRDPSPDLLADLERRWRMAR